MGNAGLAACIAFYQFMDVVFINYSMCFGKRVLSL